MLRGSLPGFSRPLSDGRLPARRGRDGVTAAAGARRDSDPNVRALDRFAPREIPVVQAARTAAPTRASPAARPSASAVSDGELLALAGRGLSLRRIAREAGLSHETVRRRLRR
jgi:DNA-binding NarL/FixJ family response regulator